MGGPHSSRANCPARQREMQIAIYRRTFVLFVTVMPVTFRGATAQRSASGAIRPFRRTSMKSRIMLAVALGALSMVGVGPASADITTTAQYSGSFPFTLV